MNKRLILKIILFGILVCISVLIAFKVKPITNKEVYVSFDVFKDNSNSEIYQIFFVDYSNDFTDYSENEKRDINIDENNKLNVKVGIPSTSNKLRIDIGEKSHKVQINNLKFLDGEKEILINSNCWNSIETINNIDVDSITGNNILLIVSGDDPYISWDISGWGVNDYIQKKIDDSNRIIIRVIIVFLWVIYLFFIKHFDFFFEFPLEIYQSKTLIFQLAKNDFSTRYAGSVFGIFWAFVQPVITILIYWFVFEKAFHSGQISSVPFVLWLIAGMVPWFFFSDSVMGGTDALISYNYLVKKVVFKIDILPLVKIISASFVHIFFVCFTVFVYICYGKIPSFHVIQLIYYSFCTLILALGIAYATSAIVGFFRDLTQIINIILMILTWLTPIMWNFNTSGLSGWIKVAFMLNPLFYIVQGYRDALIDHIWFWERPTLTIYFWVITVMILGMGTIIFKKLKVHFADVL